MSRPLRLQFSGAVYHVTSRGNARQEIFLRDDDRWRFLDLLGKEVAQQRWICYAYCLMDNHYHLLIETPEPNLVIGMRRLNAVYSQSFNRRHRRVGHLLQGRYKAILVQKQSYFMELCRYIVLNPVRANAVEHPIHWPWSSYRATLRGALAPSWLAANAVLQRFANGAAYERFVAEGIGKDPVWTELRAQIYLGGDDFLKEVQARVPKCPTNGIARAHRVPFRPNPQATEMEVAKTYGLPQDQVLDRRNTSAYKATVYLLRRVCNLSLAEVAQRAQISITRVSQIQTEIERAPLDEKLRAIVDRFKVKI